MSTISDNRLAAEKLREFIREYDHPAGSILFQLADVIEADPPRKAHPVADPRHVSCTDCATCPIPIAQGWRCSHHLLHIPLAAL